MTARPGTRSAIVALVMTLLGLLVVSMAAGAGSDGPASLTNVTVSADGTVSGELTVNGVLDGGPGALSASMGSTTLQVVTQAVAPTARGTFVVIDTSPDMGEIGLAAAKAGVKAFLSVVPEDVLLGLVTYDASARVVVPLTGDRGAISKGIDAVELGSGRATYDAIGVALNQLGAAGQRGLLLMTAGADASSSATKAQVLASLTSAKVPTLVVSYKTSATDSATLAELTKVSGGRSTAVTDEATTVAAFTGAARQFPLTFRWSVRTDDSLYGDQRLVLSGASGGTTFGASGSVDLGAAPVVQNAPPAAIDVPQPTVLLGLPLQVLLGLGAVLVGLVGVVVALASPALASRGAVRAREISRAFESRLVETRPSPSAITESLVAFGDKVMKDRDSTSRVVALIERADLPLRAGEWWVLRAASVFLFGLIGYVVLHVLSIGGLVIGVVAGIFLPSLLLRQLAARRAKAFERQLPDILTLIASSLQTGFSLMQSLDAVAHDAAQPSAKEFGRMMSETRIGADVDEALDRLAVRMGSRNMELAATAVRVQRQVGGNLAETLRTTAGTLREREALARTVQTLAAEGKLSAYILIALPFFVFFVTLYTNYAYISQLWTTVIGLGMLGYGVVSLAVGIFLMRKMIEVKV